MWLKTSHSLRNQLSMVITNLYSLNQKLIELKYNQKIYRIFRALLIENKITSINPNLFPQIFHHQVHFPIKKCIIQFDTTSRFQRHQCLSILHNETSNIQHITFPISFYLNNFSNSSASNILVEGRSLIVLEKLMGFFHVFRQKLIKTPVLESVFIFTKKNFPKCFLFSADNQLGW